MAVHFSLFTDVCASPCRMVPGQLCCQERFAVHKDSRIFNSSWPQHSQAGHSLESVGLREPAESLDNTGHG